MILERLEDPNWLSNTWLVAAGPGEDEERQDGETQAGGGWGQTDSFRSGTVTLTHRHPRQ